MRNFTITNSDNTKMVVDLIRYFKFKTDCFLIYSIGEVDEKNYKKLYLVRIMEELGFPVVQTIQNEADWANMQGIVKKVLKELKKNDKKLTEDLDYKEIEGIKISNPRFFKLDSKLVDILSSNYMGDEQLIDSDEALIDNTNDEIGNMPLESIDDTLKNQAQYASMQDVQPVAPLTTDGGPVELEPFELSNVENDIQKDDSIMEQPITVENNAEQIVETPIVAQTNEVQPIEPVVDEQVSIIEQPIEPVPVENNVEQIVETPIVAQTNEVQSIESVVEEKSDDKIDYKSLYLAMKKDNEVTSELLNDLMMELEQYKNKYGEL